MTVSLKLNGPESLKPCLAAVPLDKGSPGILRLWLASQLDGRILAPRLPVEDTHPIQS